MAQYQILLGGGGGAYHLCFLSVVSKERHWCGAFDAISLPNLVGGIGKPEIVKTIAVTVACA